MENRINITLLARNTRVKVPVVKDHYWYDTDSSTWFHGRGGQMKFVYRSSEKKSVPYIFDLEEFAQKNNFDEIERTVNDFLDKYDANIVSRNPKYSMEIDIDKNVLKDVMTELYEKNILWQS